MGVNLGKYRHPGMVKTSTDGAKSTTGTTPQTLANYKTLQFSIESRRASQVLRDGQPAGVVTHVLRTPWPGATIAGNIQRPAEIVINSRTFKLVEPRVNRDEMNEELELLCTEEVV